MAAELSAEQGVGGRLVRRAALGKAAWLAAQAQRAALGKAERQAAQDKAAAQDRAALVAAVRALGWLTELPAFRL